MLFEAIFVMGQLTPFDLKLSNPIPSNSSKLCCGLVEVDQQEDFTPVSSKAKA